MNGKTNKKRYNFIEEVNLMEFKIVENGQMVDCKVLFTFSDDNNNIDYIVYTDGSKKEDGSLNVYGSRYVKQNDNFVLKEIENESEWDLIDKMIEKNIN